MSDIAPATVSAPAEAPADNQALPKDVPNAAASKAPAQKIKIGDMEFADENAARSEIERGRQSIKLLTEAQKRLEVASKKERDAAGRFKGIRETPIKLLEAMQAEGMSREDALDMLGKLIYEQEILPKQMSPEQKRIRELEAETAKFKADREGESKKQKQLEFQKQVSVEVQKLKDELEPILKNKQIPNTRVALKRMALMMKSYEEAGVKIPAARAVDMLMQDYQTEFGELLDGAGPDQLEAFLGKERMVKLARSISQWALARAKVKAPVTEAVTDDVTKAKQAGKKMTPEQFNKFIGAI